MPHNDLVAQFELNKRIFYGEPENCPRGKYFERDGHTLAEIDWITKQEVQAKKIYKVPNTHLKRK